jgi:hypothetical protein
MHMYDFPSVLRWNNTQLTCPCGAQQAKNYFYAWTGWACAQPYPSFYYTYWDRRWASSPDYEQVRCGGHDTHPHPCPQRQRPCLSVERGGAEPLWTSFLVVKCSSSALWTQTGTRSGPSATGTAEGLGTQGIAVAGSHQKILKSRVLAVVSGQCA